VIRTQSFAEIKQQEFRKRSESLWLILPKAFNFLTMIKLKSSGEKQSGDSGFLPSSCDGFSDHTGAASRVF
jgi:hypothetical protein